MDRNEAVKRIMDAVPKSGWGDPPKSGPLEKKLLTVVPDEVEIVVTESSQGTLEVLILAPGRRVVRAYIQGNRFDSTTFNAKDVVAAGLDLDETSATLELRLRASQVFKFRMERPTPEFFKLFEAVRP